MERLVELSPLNTSADFTAADQEDDVNDLSALSAIAQGRPSSLMRALLAEAVAKCAGG